MERRFYKKEVQTRAIDGDPNRVIDGIAIVYNEWSEIMYCEKRKIYYRERILPGAASKVLQMDIIACRNHDPNLVMARTSTETLKLTDSPESLRYEFIAPNTSVGNDTLEDIKLRNINASSFAFDVEKEEWNIKPGDISERTIELFSAMYDVAPVTYPAYKQTEVNARAKQFLEEKITEIPKSYYTNLEFLIS